MIAKTKSNVIDDETPFPPMPKIIIERKEIHDLISSFDDGRYAAQKMRLINSPAETVVLLVENYSEAAVRKCARMKSKGKQERSEDTLYKTLLSAFSHSIFRDGIYVYHTSTLKDTVDWIHHSANEFALGKMQRTADYMERAK